MSSVKSVALCVGGRGGGGDLDLHVSASEHHDDRCSVLTAKLVLLQHHLPAALWPAFQVVDYWIVFPSSNSHFSTFMQLFR